MTSIINLIAITYLKSGSTVIESKEDDNIPEEGSTVNIVLTEDDQALSENDSKEISEDRNVSEVTELDELKNTSEGNGRLQGIPDINSSRDIDNLPDLGSFSTTFSSVSDSEEKMTDSEEESEYNKSAPIPRSSTFSAQGIAGEIAKQNSPEDLAKAVKTLLKKEETG